ncbi:MAG: hypothetical protein JJT75_01455 [Opitutales bacterium]|nr:hypothetical protein [Opitutales bacterium]
MMYSKIFLFHPFLLAISAFTLAVLVAPRATAENLGESVVTAAFGVAEDRETGEGPYVYLSWWPMPDSAWQPEHYAVYYKEGEPDDADSFQLAAQTAAQTDPLTVEYSLARAEEIGEDLDELRNNVEGLFDRLVPSEGLRLAEKISLIVEVAEADPETAETLTFLSRRSPAMAMAAGVSFIHEIPSGQTRTYEIRQCPGGSAEPEDCNVVVGRVVVQGGEVKPLPAPGQPVEIPYVAPEDDSDLGDPRENLNVRLRWATPPELSRRSLLQFGYDLYRVDYDLAVQNNWDSDSPDREEFLGELENQQGMARVNELPIITEQEFTEEDVANLTDDPDNFFVTDDNNRYKDEGVPFNDGDQFYYFVAARDALGRPGKISEGTPVVICHRIPPQAPRRVEVENHYTYEEDTDTQRQVFRVSWDEAEPRDDGPEIEEYWIYRWDTSDEHLQFDALPFNELPIGSLTGGRVATVSADSTEYIDNTGEHPFLSYSREGDLSTPPEIEAEHANRTFWYTVRAVDASACGGNFSGNSAPAYGVLRERFGPDTPDGGVSGNCREITLEPVDADLRPGDGPYNDSLVYLELEVRRGDQDIEWAEFYIEPFGADKRSYLGRHYFEGEEVILSVSKRLRKEFLAEAGRDNLLLARTGNDEGDKSDFAPTVRVVNEVSFDEGQPFVQFRAFYTEMDDEVDCGTHDPTPSLPGSGEVTPIEVNFNLTPQTEEWKLYRRIDGGSLSLIRQGIDSYDEVSEISFSDYELPAAGGRICYYAQLFDRHGNPSAFRRLGCLQADPRTELPQPMLSPLSPIGEDPENGGAKIEWFAAPAGVERFELWIRSDEGVTENDLADELRMNLPPEPLNTPLFTLRPVDTEEGTEFYRSYLTGRVGANFSTDEGPEHVVHWTENFSSGTEYHVRVRALDPNGNAGPWSNEETFIWTPEVDFSDPFDPEDCVVPWPIRGTPGVDGDFAVEEPEGTFSASLKAVINPTNPANQDQVAYSGGAVRVGFVDFGFAEFEVPDQYDRIDPDEEEGFFLMPRETETADIDDAFYERRNGETLTNFMLYRYQVPSDFWPEVSGDVYQVSPLIEGIAHTEVDIEGEDAFAVHDPYIMLIPIDGTNRRVFDVYVKDTQPIQQEASYRYLLVRFGDDDEIAQVIPLDTND